MIAGLPMLRSIAVMALASAAFAATKAAPKAAPKPAGATPTHMTKWEDFRILTDRNIFDRNRRPPVTRTASPKQPRTQYTAPPPPKPIDTDQYLVLLGIGLEGPQYTAFFEDSKAGKILQISPGDVVGKGRLRAVNLDSVQYDRSGKSSIVKVGYTLIGTRAASMGFAVPAPSTIAAASGSSRTGTSTTPTMSPATTQPTTAPSTGDTSVPASDGLQDILERMRQRRQQELGR